jgi:hypothetical protein
MPPEAQTLSHIYIERNFQRSYRMLPTATSIMPFSLFTSLRSFRDIAKGVFWVIFIDLLQFC